MDKTNAPEANSDISIDNTSHDSEKKLANPLNAPVSSHMKRFMKQLESAQSEKQVSPQSSQAPSEDSDVRKELAQLKAQLKAEKAKAREERAYAEARGKLSGKVRDDALELAMKVFKADGKLVIDEDGTTAFRHEGVDHDLDDGIAEWLNSKEAAVFRPAPKASKVPGKTTVKAPARVGSGNSDIKDPLQRAMAQISAYGLPI